MNCPRCGRTNDADAQFCARCGLEFAKYAATANPVKPSGFCYRHPKVATGLSCGRCERPVCTKCAINGPAGIRCRDCARHNVALRPAAVVHGVKRSVFSIGRVGPWGIYALLAIASMAFGAMRGCGRGQPDRSSEDELAITRSGTPSSDNSSVRFKEQRQKGR